MATSRDLGPLKADVRSVVDYLEVAHTELSIGNMRRCVRSLVAATQRALGIDERLYIMRAGSDVDYAKEALLWVLENVVVPREPVRALAVLMERKMRKHDGDRGNAWTQKSARWLMSRLRDEVEELEKAMGEADRAIANQWSQEAAAKLEEVRQEAADVANFAMMISDKASRGGLG